MATQVLSVLASDQEVAKYSTSLAVQSPLGKIDAACGQLNLSAKWPSK